MQLQPYVFFDGRCDEAITFYKKAVGAEVKMLMRFKDSPDTPDPEMCGGPLPSPDKVLHAELSIGQSSLLVSDGNAQGKPRFDGFSLSLTAANETEAKRLFTALSNGGKTLMPLGKTFFASSFGVSWMIYVAA